MNTLAAGTAPVLEFTGRRIERALRRRERYRYVRPRVLRDGDAWRIVSPCCSRNIDPAGGDIDIALLRPSAAAGWQLCARDHAVQEWVVQASSRHLQELLDLLCSDPQRLYWP